MQMTLDLSAALHWLGVALALVWRVGVTVLALLAFKATRNLHRRTSILERMLPGVYHRVRDESPVRESHAAAPATTHVERGVIARAGFDAQRGKGK